MADETLQDWLAEIGKKHGFASGVSGGDDGGDRNAAPGGVGQKARLVERLNQIDKELGKITALVDKD